MAVDILQLNHCRCCVPAVLLVHSERDQRRCHSRQEGEEDEEIGQKECVRTV